MCLTQKITRVNKLLSGVAKVAELVDAQASGACVRKDVGVRVPPFALYFPLFFLAFRGLLTTDSRSIFVSAAKK
jgi:hypothetical protein